MSKTPKLFKAKTAANQGLLPFEDHGPFATPESVTQELPVALLGPAEPVALPGPESVTPGVEGSMTPGPVAPVPLDRRSLTAAEDRANSFL